MIHGSHLYLRCVHKLEMHSKAKFNYTGFAEMRGKMKKIVEIFGKLL